MKTLALVLIIIGIVAVLCFSIAFFVELAKGQEAKEENEDNAAAEENEQTEEVSDEAKEETNEFDLDAMLAKLEASSEETQEQAEEQPAEETEVQEEMVLEEAPAEEAAAEQPVEEVAETPAEEAVEEQPVEEATEEVVEEQPVEEATEEVVEEQPVEEVAETPAEETENNDNSNKVIVIREKTTEVINNAPAEKAEETEEVSQEVVDLTTRLESVRASQAKVDADLTKASREINKYERTERRMARNQKLLDKKAEDLTKLNLVLYSVTDIKNIDNEKKQKQEELVTHINELKTSIKDAQTYLDTNREKYENSQRMKEFFEGEKARLDADEKEILTLMGQAGSDTTDAE